MGYALVLCMSCSSDEDPPVDDPIGNPNPGNPGSESTFAAVVAKGGTFETVPQSKTENTVSEGDEYPEDYTNGTGNDAQETRYSCKERVVSVLDGTGDFQTLGSAGTVIYPGALLQGKTINNVTPQGIPLKRAGGSISYTLYDGNPQAAQDLDEMSESKVRQGINDIISGTTGVVPANFDLVYENVFSEKQVALQMGLSFEGYGVKAEGKLAFSNEETYNRILVKLNQAYYDVSYDFPTSYDDIFDPSVTPEDLDRHIQADNPATYIKSVTYGRIFYMLIESTSSLETMNAQIEASYESFDKKIEGNLDTQSMEKMENLKVKVVAYGGDAVNTFSGLGETSLEGLSNMLAASTDIKTGLPLSYTIHSLEDTSLPVGTNISTEMNIVECTLKGVLPPDIYSNLVDLFDDGIGAATGIDNQFSAIYNAAGTEYVLFNGISGDVTEPYGIKDPSGPLGVTSFDNVGAALRAFLSKIYIFNQQGDEYEVIDYSSGNMTNFPTSPIGNYIQSGNNNIRYSVNEEFTKAQALNSTSVGYLTLYNVYNNTVGTFNEYPLFGENVQAAIRRDHINPHRHGRALGFGFPEEGFLTSNYYYSKATNGESYTRLDYYNPEGAIFPQFKVWTNERNSSYAMEAACKIEKTENQSGKEYMMYFTTDGLLVVRNIISGSSDVEEGPWAIN